VGDPLRRGLSGGQRKRLCVAIELLTQPALLFLDEPTSGLDSVTALALITLLKDLSSSGCCTAVCTIHQPNSKIFALFDSLTILRQGEILYQGSAPGAVHFFAHLGFPCPPYTNPADHLLDVITHELDDEGGRRRRCCCRCCCRCCSAAVVLLVVLAGHCTVPMLPLYLTPRGAAACCNHQCACPLPQDAPAHPRTRPSAPPPGSTHSAQLSSKLADHASRRSVDLDKGKDRELTLREVVPWRKQFRILLG
jgi:hypothetical protein